MAIGVKVIFSNQEIQFIKDNFFILTNQQLADRLGKKLTRVRTQCYELGLKRIDLEYWTDEQVKFLKENYKTIGDTEIAEIFSQLYYKQKGWDKKHIEKKRRYLKLKRTKSEISEIKERNRLKGCWSINHWKRWVDKEAKIGETRMWMIGGSPRQVIKTERGFVHHSRWLYQQIHGEIPAGGKVRLKDGNPANVIPENLELVSNEDNARLNSITSSQGLSNNYVAGMLSYREPELREAMRSDEDLISAKRTELLLNRKIKSIENGTK